MWGWTDIGTATMVSGKAAMEMTMAIYRSHYISHFFFDYYYLSSARSTAGRRRRTDDQDILCPDKEIATE
jgi:hypothetical protein